jgi:hypothetical protein
MCPAETDRLETWILVDGSWIHADGHEHYVWLCSWNCVARYGRHRQYTDAIKVAKRR